MRNGNRVILLVTCVMMGCHNDAGENSKYKRNSNSVIDSVSGLNTSLKKNNNALKNENDSLRFMLNYWFTDNFHADQLRNQGIAEPEKRILEELKKQVALIPIEGTLGGIMHFGHAQLIGTDWIIAEFDDGHVMGVGLYRYTILNDSTIKYEIIEWKHE